MLLKMVESLTFMRAGASEKTRSRSKMDRLCNTAFGMVLIKGQNDENLLPCSVTMDRCEWCARNELDLVNFVR